MSRGERLALGGIVALAVALRFPTLGLQSYWYDEGQTVDVIGHGLGGLITSAVPDTQNFPPLYFALAWLWSKVFGIGEAGLRAYSALCGTLAVLAVYWAGSVLASRRVGLIAALLAATSPLLVWYSQEARPYAMLVALAALSLALFGRAREAPTTGRHVAWAACCAVALMTHYFAVFVIAPEAALLLWARPRTRAAIWCAGALAAVGVALLPLALHQRSSGRGESIAESPLFDRARTLPNRFLLGEQGDPSGDYGRVHLFLYALVPLALAALWLAWRRTAGAERRGAGIAAAIAACAVGGPLLLGVLGYDYVVDRNLLAAWAALAVLLGCGLATSRPGVGVAAAMAALSIAVVVAVDATPRLRRDDWRDVAHRLCRPHAARVLAVRPYLALPVLRYYLPDVRPLAPGRPPGPHAVAVSVRPVRRRLEPVLALEEPAAPTAHWSSRCVR